MSHDLVGDNVDFTLNQSLNVFFLLYVPQQYMSYLVGYFHNYRQAMNLIIFKPLHGSVDSGWHGILTWKSIRVFHYLTCNSKNIQKLQSNEEDVKMVSSNSTSLTWSDTEGIGKLFLILCRLKSIPNQIECISCFERACSK